MKLFLKEIKDRYIRENFKRLQTTVAPLSTGGSGGTTVVNNTTNVVGGSADDAAKTIIKKICTETITQFSIVRLVSSTQTSLASIETYVRAKAVGIALQSGIIGDQIRILTFGILEDPSFNFTLNEPIFLDTNGVISQIPPIATTLFELNIGQSLGVGAIEIKVGEPKEIF